MSTLEIEGLHDSTSEQKVEIVLPGVSGGTKHGGVLCFSAVIADGQYGRR
jgi:hypothetical protein